MRSRILSIGALGVSIAMAESMIGNLSRIRTLRGGTFDLKLSRIPASYPQSDSHIFDSMKLCPLFDAGAEWGCGAGLPNDSAAVTCAR